MGYFYHIPPPGICQVPFVENVPVSVKNIRSLYVNVCDTNNCKIFSKYHYFFRQKKQIIKSSAGNLQGIKKSRLKKRLKF